MEAVVTVVVAVVVGATVVAGAVRAVVGGTVAWVVGGAETGAVPAVVDTEAVVVVAFAVVDGLVGFAEAQPVTNNTRSMVRTESLMDLRELLPTIIIYLLSP